MMFAWMVDFGDISIRFDRIESLRRGVDGTEIKCGYGREERIETATPYREALRLYEEVRAQAELDYNAHQIALAKVQRVV